MKEDNLFRKAERKAGFKRWALFHLYLWSAFLLFFFYIDLFQDGDSGLEWFFYPMFFWGIGLFSHIFAVFDVFGLRETWEKKELRKEIEKRKLIAMELNEELDDDILDLDEIYELRKEYKDEDLV